MTLSTSPTTRSLTVPGARLHYEIRGAGPLLLVIGSPMAAAEFAPLADALASDHTVVTYDPRGYAGSMVDDPDAPSGVEERADDVNAILDDLGPNPPTCSGPAAGRSPVSRSSLAIPGRIRTLVAHEPPLLELLPDAAEQRVDTEAIVDTFHRDGFRAAWAHFMRNAGFGLNPDDAPPIESNAVRPRAP